MIRLDRLTASKKISDRWYAEFSDGGRLKVNTALIADFSLFTGRELDDDEYGALLSAAGAAETRARALRIIGSRSMSRRELVKRLTEKGEAEDAAEAAADWLEKIGAINDAEYAPMLVRHYAAKGYGAGRIRDELYRRGVPRELWDGAFCELPDQDDAIDRLISSRLRGAAPDAKEKKRVSDMLCRRGFSWDEIRSALARYGESVEDME